MGKARLTKTKEPGNHLAHKLRTLRLQRSLQQKEIAKVAGVHPIQYGRYERGDSTPTTDVLKRLAIALEVSYDYLLNDESGNDDANIFGDEELLRLFQEVARFPDKDKNVVKETLDAFVIKRKVRNL